MSLQFLPFLVLFKIATYLTGNIRDVINFSHLCKRTFRACETALEDYWKKLLECSDFSLSPLLTERALKMAKEGK
jgi:hypothetical protein